MPLLDLPDEILLLIIESLPTAKDVLSMLLTTSRVYAIQQMGPLYNHDIKCSGSSLSWYSKKGYISTIETMLQRGAKVDCTDKDDCI
ncbi:hypothetical protein BDV41DRAFT_77847 [Aspergillus transmontanensis]|uniref:F-box domain-containing protein n=1 Tax=Aspergillus transmontanensis TaxID=1034304 RepID=A0A5N6WAT5_9EURO|nr:hypothetical protein BDV41DRAFT_77847 [Aspergillus transmontanensis]